MLLARGDFRVFIYVRELKGALCPLASKEKADIWCTISSRITGVCGAPHLAEPGLFFEIAGYWLIARLYDFYEAVPFRNHGGYEQY